MKTVALAQQAGANVNLTWWEGPYPAEEQKRRMVMDDFAATTASTSCTRSSTTTHGSPTVSVAARSLPA
jgi:hypothetical protein